MAATIKDIARIAGVSHTTVSRALRDHPAIAPDTTARVKQVANDVGYLPSAVARGLKTQRSQAIGVIVSSIDDPFFSEVLQGIEDVLLKTGYSLFVAASHRDLDCERAIVRAMGERRVDGIILCSTPFNTANARQLQAYGMPITVINNQAAEDYRYSIYHDDQFGSDQVTQHLISLGHRKIAFLGNSLAGRTTQDRQAGFHTAILRAGLDVPQSYYLHGPNGRPEGGFAAGELMLDLPEPPTAVVCFNDMMAIGLISVLQRAGRRIPEDCSVTGFDNISISAFISPPLTTFHQPKYHLGYEAAQMMLRLLNPRPEDPITLEPQIKVFTGELLVRSSTGPPPF